MGFTAKKRNYAKLSLAIACWIALPGVLGSTYAATDVGTTKEVVVRASAAEEEAKYDSQHVSIITKEEIEKKQAKSVEDIIFTETGVSRTVDSMGRVGVSIRGAEPRHTLILVDGQAVLGDLAKFSGAADEVMRLGTENVERIEVVQGAASAKYGADAIGGVINIVTKKAAKKPGVQFNAEGSRLKGDSGLPYSNFFLRADSGQMGKFRIGLSGSKRDILPVYATVSRRATGMGFDYKAENFKPNVLRYYGDASDIGLVGTYDINANHNVQFRLNRYAEDLVRDVKHSDSDLEPQQHFKRQSDRNTFNVSWNGRNDKTDWTVEGNYSRIKENDISLVNYAGRSLYEGKNELRYIDDVDHRQYDVRFNANTQVNDQHLLSYGVGLTHETGSGSRLKSSPITRTRHIDPWDYDKNILVEKLDRINRKPGDNRIFVWSHIHDYKFTSDPTSRIPKWDLDYEYYGYDSANSSTLKPQVDYNDYVFYNMKDKEINKVKEYWWSSNYIIDGKDIYGNRMSEEAYGRYDALRRELLRQNPGFTGSNIVGKYFEYGQSNDPTELANAPKLNGKRFMEEYRDRDQRITEGEGTIKKRNFFIQDTWQVNDDTIITPSLRFDHSNLFGGHWSYNLGVTHNVASNPHRRFKANIGTGYSEPGMGELWYNWEMFASNPVGIGVAKMGWYWAGNPNLKPEKSVNFDIGFEAENKNTTFRGTVFHNRIKDYMSVYYTGLFQDFAPYLSAEDKYTRAPDLIYSFKNIGRAEITGLSAEVKQKFGNHWSGRLGYTLLHAINKSDPNMPRNLLDKPKHKIDLGLTFDDKTSGWNAQVWGEYYVNMLDSNTLRNRSNYWPDILDGVGAVFGKQEYDRKTFGIWNLMVQKRFNGDNLVYFGINNLFNHHDDDRATQSRVYRFGVNLKFGPDGRETSGNKKEAVKTVAPAMNATNGSAEGAKQVVPGVSSKDGVTTITDAEGNVTTPISVGVEPALSNNANEVNTLNSFIMKPFDTAKKEGIEFIGDYRAQMMSHGGYERPQSPFREDSFVGTAAYNMYDRKEHSFEQRVRAGFDARIGENTNVKVLGSASGRSGVDTNPMIADSRGLNKQRIDELDVTQHVQDGTNHWDFSVGRLHERLGATGYWFGKEFDGARAVWTGKDAQVRIGYGSFKHSTGISDSPYTHVTIQSFFRAPTIEEFLGINRNDFAYDIRSATEIGPDGRTYAGSPNDIYERLYKGKTDSIYFYQQLKDAYETAQNNGATPEELAQVQMDVLKRMQPILKAAYGNELEKQFISLTPSISSHTVVVYEVEAPDGTKYLKQFGVNYSPQINAFDSEEEIALKKEINSFFGSSLSSTDILDKAFLENENIKEGYHKIAEYTAIADWKNYATPAPWGPNALGPVIEYDLNTGAYRSIQRYDVEVVDFKYNGVKDLIEVKPRWDYTLNRLVYDINKLDIAKTLYDSNYVQVNQGGSEYGWRMTNVVFNYLDGLEKVARESEAANKLPRESLGKVVGNLIQVTGKVLEQDTIPAIDRAAFVQYKQMVDKNLGLVAWYLRSFGDPKQTYLTANGMGNDAFSPKKLANVFGIGARYDLGRNAVLSVDYGINRSDFGRYMNGHSIVNHIKGTANFDLKGRALGKDPHFWTARLDIGQSDFDRPGSWNAYVDYKYFQHGSFFGGNGTGAVPDRYLDGIRSFTFGAGYVPRKDLLLEAFYTFDAKGTKQRDTLYGPESFKLGNYTRIQGTYKF